MTLTYKILLIQLLAILSLICIAHALPIVTTLHNKDSVIESSLVRNWTLICEDLCSLNTSGPACGLDCQKLLVKEDLIANIRNITQKDRELLCEKLCDYELGDNQCECKVPIIPASFNFQPAVHRPDRYKICSDACRSYHTTLKGCSRCPFEEKDGPKERHHNSHTNSNSHKYPVIKPQIPVPQSANPNYFRPVQNHFMIQTTTDSTTPDWNRLCAQLCRNGTGGLLCNCDLPPF